jgi:hypothetical protein
MNARLGIASIERLRLYGGAWGSELEAIVTCTFDHELVEPLLVRRTKEGEINLHSMDRLCLDGQPIVFLSFPNEPRLRFYDPRIPRHLRAMVRDELRRRLIDYADVDPLLSNPRFGGEQQ